MTDDSIGAVVLDVLKLFGMTLFALVVFAGIGGASYEATLHALHDTHVCHAGKWPR